MFKPLRIPSHFHPYPPNFFKHLPRFIGEDYIIADKHFGSFENFVDNFEIVYEDVVVSFFQNL